MNVYAGLVALVLFNSTSVRAAEGTNLITSDAAPVRFGAEGELFVPVPIENATVDGERIRIRSVELTSQFDLQPFTHSTGPPPHNVIGNLTLGADDQSGDLTLNIREGYVAFLNAGIPGSQLRVGKFYLPVGILNQVRRSAWSFPSAPRPISLFFTDSGVVDTGVDLNYSVEHFEIRVGVTNGYRFDSSISNGGTRPQTPTHFVRPMFRFSTGENRVTLAANYLSRVDDQGSVMRISGLDLDFQPVDPSRRSWSAQSEVYHRYQNPQKNLSISEDIGGYAFVKRSFDGGVGLGLRLDAYKIPSLTDQQGLNRRNLTLALVPVFEYVERNMDHSPVSLFRWQASYTYLREARDGDTVRTEQSFEIRLVTEFGDLPRSRTPIAARVAAE